MIPEISTASQVNAPPYRLLREIKTISEDIGHLGKGTNNDLPLLLAKNFTEVAFFPHGYGSLPIMIKPGKIMDKGKETDAVIVKYWVDNEPEIASGIVHQQQLLLYKNAEGVHACIYSPPPDQKGSGSFITSTSKSYVKQAENLWNAIGRAASLTTAQMPNIYADLRYDFNQILASHEILRSITTIIQGEQQKPTQSAPVPLRRRWLFAIRTPHSMPLPVKNRAA